MEVQVRALNIGGRPPVVVNDRHLIARVQQLPVLDLLGPVGVHHHQQGAGVRPEHGLLAVQQHALILGHLCHALVQLVGGSAHMVPHNIVRNSLHPGDGAYAHRRAHRVEVGGLVAHDHDAGGVRHQLAHGGGHDPALDLGAPLGFLAAPAEELEGKTVLDHRLIAPAGQGHLHRQAGEAVQLVKGVRVHPDADGEGGGDAGGIDHLPHAVQQGELLLLIIRQVLFFKKKQVAVPVQPQERAVGLLRPVGEPLDDVAEHGRADVLVLPLDGVLVVVQQQQGQHGLGGLVDVPGVGQIGDIQPVGGGKQSVRLIGGGPGHVPEHLIAPPVQLHLNRALAFALQQPAAVEAGGQVGHFGVEHPLLVPGEAQEAVVGPHHLIGVRPEHHQGEGAVQSALPGGLIHAVHDLLEEIVGLPLAPEGGGRIGDEQHPDDDQLRHRRLLVVQQSGDAREGQHHGEVQPDAGGQHPRQLLIHLDHLFQSLFGKGAYSIDIRLYQNQTTKTRPHDKSDFFVIYLKSRVDKLGAG